MVSINSSFNLPLTLESPFSDEPKYDDCVRNDYLDGQYLYLFGKVTTVVSFAQIIWLDQFSTTVFKHTHSIYLIQEIEDAIRMKILFVCDGNICRSPVAATFFCSNLENGSIEVRSAGIYASVGRPLIQQMQQVLSEYGLTVDHASQKISSENLTWADLVFTMTRPQKFILISMVPTIADKVYTLQEYIGHPAQDVAVPRDETLSAYRQCADYIRQSCLLLYRELFQARYDRSK